jgi:hypothetical protein
VIKGLEGFESEESEEQVDPSVLQIDRVAKDAEVDLQKTIT